MLARHSSVWKFTPIVYALKAAREPSKAARHKPPEAALQSQSFGVKISFRLWMAFLNLTEAARKC